VVFIVGLAVLGLIISPHLGMAKDTAKLGFVYIMSGPFATYGQFAKQGAELAIEEINQKGGILGKKVEGLFEDSQGKPDVGVRVIRKLVMQDDVGAVIGLDSSGVAQTVVPLMEELQTPLIVTHAATPSVTGKLCNKYTFRISVSLDQNVKAAAIIASESKAKTWTTIGPDYAFGYESWEYFQKYLSKLKPDVKFFGKDQVAFAPTKTTDFAPYITKVMESNPEGVLISLWGGNLIDFVKQAGEMGFFKKDWQILMTLGAATEVLYALKDKMPENLWVGTRYWFLANQSPLNKSFVEAYHKKYGEYPSYNAHGAYAAVYAYKEAVEKAKSFDKNKVIQALEGLELEAPIGQLKIRKEDHQALSPATWGKTKADPKYPIRILDPIRIFPAEQVTPPIEETECKMK